MKLIGFLFALNVFAQETYLIRNATIHPVTGASLRRLKTSRGALGGKLS